MSSPKKRLYEFGDFTFDPIERALIQNGNQTPLSPKVSEALLALLEEAGHTVSHEDLIKRIWADTLASKNNLDQIIFQLRKLLGDSPSELRYIKTVPRLGYQFLPSVREALTEPATEAEEKGGEDAVAFTLAPETLPATAAPAEASVAHTAEAERRPQPEIRGTAQANGVVRRWLVVSLLLVAVAVLAFVFYRLSARAGKEPTHAPKEAAKTWNIQTDGAPESAALSPAGNRVAYIIKEGERSNIWVAGTDGSPKQLVAGEAGDLSDLVFSVDGESIYYNRSKEGGSNLYSVPVDGGPPTKILENARGRISFSPDGKQFAFITSYMSEGESVLLVADSDGTGARRIAARKAPTYFFPWNGPAWSPDGKTIVAMEEAGSANFSTLTAFDVAGGTERRIITPSAWPRFRDVAWLPDGSGLMVIVTEGGPTAPTQIWQLSYPGLESRKIADGPGVYESLSLARTSNRILTLAHQSTSDIWVLSQNEEEAEGRRSTNTGMAGRAGLCWTPDGRIVYHSREGGVDMLRVMNSDGSNGRLLTEGSTGNFYPSITSDGRRLIFMSRRTGMLHIWRMDLESGAQTQLTSGSEEQFPQVSADGRWVYYNSWESEAGNVWKISIDGGQPSKVIAESSYHPKPSPDGKLLAYTNLVDEPGASRRKVVPMEGGPARYSFGGPLVRLGPVHWSKDSSALLYVDQRDGAWNIWSQPIEGGEPMQLTHFTEGRIYYFDQSWDGRWLAVTRGNESKDVILFSGYN